MGLGAVGAKIPAWPRAAVRICWGDGFILGNGRLPFQSGESPAGQGTGSGRGPRNAKLSAPRDLGTLAGFLPITSPQMWSVVL